jgi:hypothetical protein
MVQPFCATENWSPTHFPVAPHAHPSSHDFVERELRPH